MGSDRRIVSKLLEMIVLSQQISTGLLAYNINRSMSTILSVRWGLHDLQLLEDTYT